MRPVARRKFMITGGAATTIGLSFSSLGLSRRAIANNLVSDPNRVLDLPEGFSYKILISKNDTMNDGYHVPARPDAMACFCGPDNTLILMCNHENSIGAPGGPFKRDQPPPHEAYDAEGSGGVIRIVIDATTYDRRSSNLVLCGTSRNCAGGLSPWGWLSCEEHFAINNGIRHGYVFLCPIDAETVQSPRRIDGYGRFNHEAVCIDPSNNYAYLTEDRGDGCLYRFVPDSMNEPFVGVLQALKIAGHDQYDTGEMSEGDVFAVEWVDVDDLDPDSDTVRDQAHARGAAVVVRGEGIWFSEGQVFFNSTSGGPTDSGQIFCLIDGVNPTLECFVRSTDTSVLNHPGNITVAPWGGVFVCEDADGDNYIRTVNETGEVTSFARNCYSYSALCGVCFSPDGRAMFVNLQADGLTLVITGPFDDDDGRG